MQHIFVRLCVGVGVHVCQRAFLANLVVANHATSLYNSPNDRNHHHPCFIFVLLKYITMVICR